VITFEGETALLVGICFVVNLLGLVGLTIFPPPGRRDGPGPAPTDDQRNEERWERDQIARVAGEPDVDRTGDGA